ncbi:translocon subunit [Starmerella bacillaris]|uniref:Translocon subunit n=1 Tax=Starmerella bacillaris TaxID=1247836 RepID=A0AAV5RIV9_STABA|nr:translocon subunit [Starmerella bacillaris]
MAQPKQNVLEAPNKFFEDSRKFLARCTKPSAKEYYEIVRAVGSGFIVMGVLGYVVKLIHIPIRHFITV